MRPVIVWELRQRRLALLWWSLGSVLLSVFIIALFPSIRDKAQQLNSVINQLPQGLRELKTGGASSVNVADPIAFLNSQLFYATLPILWIILAITRGSGLLGKEEQSHTIELLLSRPISRGMLLLSKGLSLGLEFLIVGSLSLLAIIITAPLFGLHVGDGRLALATIYTALFCLSFGLLAFTFKASSPVLRHSATALAVLIGFGGYILASLSGLTDWLKTPAKFAPYHYFMPQNILHGQAVVGLDIYLVGVLIFAVLVSYFSFRRRDVF